MALFDGLDAVQRSRHELVIDGLLDQPNGSSSEKRPCKPFKSDEGVYMHASQLMSENLVAVTEIPERTKDAVRMCIVDAIAASITALHNPGVVAAWDGAADIWGQGEHDIWFSGRRSTAIGAAFANSAAVSMLDIDDGHRAAAGHPGAAIIPAVLAVGQVGKVDQNRLLAAIAIGYEVGVRISSARDLKAIDTVATGRWCGQGVAAAVGWLRAFSAEKLAHAISIAESIAPYRAAVEATKMGSHVKEGIPFATVNGMQAVCLAHTEFVGALDILDDLSYYRQQTLVGEIGSSWLVETRYFKPYSCCRWIHASLDALLVMRSNGLKASQISSIRVEVIRRALTLNNLPEPGSLQAAQYSFPFCLGVAAVYGISPLRPMTAHSLLTDAAVLSVSHKVKLVFNEELESFYPARVPSRVVVTTTDGRQLAATVMDPLGEAGNPMSWAQLFEKFDDLAEKTLQGQDAATLRNCLHAVRNGDLSPLQSFMAKPIRLRKPAATRAE